MHASCLFHCFCLFLCLHFRLLVTLFLRLLLWLFLFVGCLGRQLNFFSYCETVHGALRCLALFSGDLDDVQLPPLIPVLFPSLYTIVTSTEVSLSLVSTLFKVAFFWTTHWSAWNIATVIYLPLSDVYLFHICRGLKTLPVLLKLPLPVSSGHSVNP